MGRPRKNKKDNVLPPRVRSNGYSYVWKPEGSTRSIGLGRVRKTSVAKVWQNYELEKAKLHNIMTVAKLWHMFMDSPAFTELAPRTQKDYRQHQKALLMVFGKML
ncbi:integrase, partial [Escherichia coli]